MTMSLNLNISLTPSGELMEADELESRLFDELARRARGLSYVDALMRLEG